MRMLKRERINDMVKVSALFKITDRLEKVREQLKIKEKKVDRFLDERFLLAPKIEKLTISLRTLDEDLADNFKEINDLTSQEEDLIKECRRILRGSK